MPTMLPMMVMPMMMMPMTPLLTTSPRPVLRGPLFSLCDNKALKIQIPWAAVNRSSHRKIPGMLTGIRSAADGSTRYALERPVDGRSPAASGNVEPSKSTENKAKGQIRQVRQGKERQPEIRTKNVSHVEKRKGPFKLCPLPCHFCLRRAEHVLSLSHRRFFLS